VNRLVRKAQVRRRRHPRHSVRQTAATVFMLGCVLAFGWFTTDEIVVLRQRAAAVHNPTEAEPYSGSILYTPDQGMLCRQFLFDNRGGGVMRDNGMVDCLRAAYQGSDNTPKQWSNDRMRVIATGFRKG
jgi:hypothetical protein